MTRRLRCNSFVRSLEDRLAPATFTVMNLADGGADSLRDCITKANAAAGADTIQFNAGLAGTITLASVLLVSDALTVTGPRAASLTISGNNKTTHLSLQPGAAGPAFTISGLTVAQGKGQGNSGAIGSGKGVQLTLNNCVLTGNTTPGGSGGAIAAYAGTVTVTDCTFTNNSANSGGAIYQFGAGAKTVLNRCVISGNTASSTGSGLFVHNYLLVENSTIALNKTSGGTAISVDDNGGPGNMIVRNSTISGNSSGHNGGIRFGCSGTLTVQNSTITANSSPLFPRGGIASTGTGTIAIESSIVSGNIGSSAGDVYSSGIVTVKNSAIGSAAGFTKTDLGGNLPFQTHTNLKLGALFNNGGQAQTHLPQPGSPLIDAGSNLLLLTVDQRGVTRQLGSAIDMGAVEAVTGSLVVNSLNNAGPGSLRQAVGDANIDPGANTIDFDRLYFNIPKNIVLTSGEIAIGEAVSINGAGASFSSVSGNAASRIFNLSSAPAGSIIAIADLEIRAGNTGGFGGALLGGDEALVLTGCKLNTNISSAGSGGAVAITNGGSLTATDCTCSSNSASIAGGAIDVFGAGCFAELRRCTVSNNAAATAGGVFLIGPLLLENCALTGNQATAGAGGAVAFAYAGTMIVRNSTVSGNTSAKDGGGVHLPDSGSALFVEASTIRNNTAIAGKGGGIGDGSGTNSIKIDSGIVAGNTNAVAPDIFSSGLVQGVFSAIGTKTGITIFTGDATTNALLGANLKLGPLAANGGLTWTHLPLAGSPLINAGRNPLGHPTDQRGASRTLGVAADVGSVETIPLGLVVANANDAGPGSLRQSITDANVGAGLNTVTFDPIFFATAKSITLLGGEMAISEAVTVTGPGATLVTVNANKLSRVFNTSAAAAAAKIAISGLSMTAGNANSGLLYGGAIFGDGEHIEIANCVFSLNTANAGGAVSLQGNGTLSATDCAFLNNTATFGGAIYVSGSSAKTTLLRCSITGNVADFVGGIYVREYLLLHNSTVANNTAKSGSGGGVALSGFGGTGNMVVRNSTISGNTANVEGGGILLTDFAGTLTVQNSTITANNGQNSVGGISRFTGNGAIAIESGIVSGNISPFAPDILSSGKVSVKTSAIGSASGFTRTDLGGNLPFQAHANLKLGALSDNGGATQTHLPALDSPLLNKGSNPQTLTDDQRGPGFARSRSGGIDMGAAEARTQFVVLNAADAGVGSLRQAVLDANSFSGTDTISFDPVVFATAQSITLTTGQLLVADSVTITGPGADKVAVSGNNASRVVEINGPGTLNVVLSGLTITQGYAAASLGAGIFCYDETLTVQQCVISANKADVFAGISTFGLLTVIDSQIVNNTATFGNVGGIGGVGGTVILRSTISGNNATGSIGGLYAGVSLMLESSTVSGNTAAFDVGGILITSYLATPSTIINSTISGNTAASNAGGLCAGYSNLPFNGTVIVRNSTITDNIAAAGKGGGIARLFATGTIELASTIVSGNAAAASGPDLYTAGAVNAKTNLIGNLSGVTTFVPDAITSLNLGKAPLLGTLANNGGPTLTHALSTGSPCIDVGSNLALLPTDQRGPGFLRFVGGGADIGAFEVQAAVAKVAAVAINAGAVQRSRVTTLSVTFDSAVTLPANPANAFELKRQSDNAAVTLGATQLGNTVTLTFTGAASDFNSLADGRYTLTVLAAQVNGGNFDGDGNGAAGDNFVLVGDPATNKLFRLFGDADGDNDVDTTDFGAIRAVFGGTSATFDFDNDGDVDTSDFGAFRARFGASV